MIDRAQPRRFAKLIRRSFEFSEFETLVCRAFWESGLFLALFSAFDAFTGNLIAALFNRRPELFGKINRSVSFSEILSAQSINELKDKVLFDEIEQFRRKSYTEQFDQLSSRFDIKLTDFASWPLFVEASQRRNLITHCDSVVSDQYIAVCNSVGIKGADLPKIGRKSLLGFRILLQDL